jgi:hypothetical protein
VLAIKTLDASGIASFTTSSLRMGNHLITVDYAGDANYRGTSSAMLTQMVNPSTTAIRLTSSVNPAGYRQPVTFTATVASLNPGAGTPQGTVMFEDGTRILGSARLDASGKATLTISSLRLGRHSITAVYTGDPDHSASMSARLPLSIIRSSTATSLASSASSSVYGRAVTFTATVAMASSGAGTPTGTVIFRDGARVLGTRRLNGKGLASFTSSRLRAGKHLITVIYTGNANYQRSISLKLTHSVSA